MRNSWKYGWPNKCFWQNFTIFSYLISDSGFTRSAFYYYSLEPPTYQNPSLLQKINDNKNKSEISFQSSHLTDNDIFIIAYYLLQNNTVSYFTFPTSFQLKTFFFIGSRVSHRDSSLLFVQTLTTLNLNWNKIGDQGAQATGQALQTNKVTQTMILFNFYHIHLSLFI